MGAQTGKTAIEAAGKRSRRVVYGCGTLVGMIMTAMNYLQQAASHETTVRVLAIAGLVMIVTMLHVLSRVSRNRLEIVEVWFRSGLFILLGSELATLAHAVLS